MKTIKIFLASSEELDNDRMAFGNLVRRLDDMYEKRGIRIKLFEWEDYDAAYNDRRKQDEYNDHVRQSDIFLALFHKKAGKFTMEEFNIASEEFREHASPKVYTYCKDLKDGEEESAELKEFKQRLFDEMGHYWCRYDNRESLQLQFVMQLQLVENSQMEGLKVENGEVTLDGLRVASMDKLQFAAANEDYLRMQTDLHELRDEIENMQLKLEKKEAKLEKKKAKLEEDPDDEDYQEEYQELKEEVDELIDRLQPKLNKYNKLKEDFAEHQQLLFNTAKRVAQLQGERITERMRRAMDALTEGKVREANIILDEAESDARRNLEDYLQSKEITEQKRQNVISSIEELQLKATSVMSDASIPIEERIEKTEKIYEQADEMAQECGYETDRNIDLLFIFGTFLNKYARYNKALKVYRRLASLCENSLDEGDIDISYSYKCLGVVFSNQGDYITALKYYQKACDVLAIPAGRNNHDMADIYLGMGHVYEINGDSDKALYYYNKTLDIYMQQFGENHTDTAIALNNIGNVYITLDDYQKALEYHRKALSIREKLFPSENLDLSYSYNNIGVINDALGNYSSALDYYKKSLKIDIKLLGENNPDTAISYDNIGVVYSRLGNDVKSLEYHVRALEIREKVLGKDHIDTATSYNNIGGVYHDQGDYVKSMDYYAQALKIFEVVLGIEHLKTAMSYNNIGSVYHDQGDYSTALDYYNKALTIRLKVFGENHSDTAWSYINIGNIYVCTNDYSKALEYYQKAAFIREKIFGCEHSETANAYNYIAWTLHLLGKYVEALPWATKARDTLPDDSEIVDTLAMVYRGLGRYDEALEQFGLCLKLKKEQGASEDSIHETEEKIEELKKLMK